MHVKVEVAGSITDFREGAPGWAAGAGPGDDRARSW